MLRVVPCDPPPHNHRALCMPSHPEGHQGSRSPPGPWSADDKGPYHFLAPDTPRLSFHSPERQGCGRAARWEARSQGSALEWFPRSVGSSEPGPGIPQSGAGGWGARRRPSEGRCSPGGSQPLLTSSPQRGEAPLGLLAPSDPRPQLVGAARTCPFVRSAERPAGGRRGPLGSATGGAGSRFRWACGRPAQDQSPRRTSPELRPLACAVSAVRPLGDTGAWHHAGPLPGLLPALPLLGQQGQPRHPHLWGSQAPASASLP